MVEHPEHRIQYGKEKLKVGQDPHIKAVRTQIIVNLVVIGVVNNRNSHKHKQADKERNNQSNILIYANLCSRNRDRDVEEFVLVIEFEVIIDLL